MNVQTSYVTDVGIKKATNQDSIVLKVANTNKGRVAMAVVCDGMGGLAKGEIASAELAKAFSDWFMFSFPQLLQKGFTAQDISAQWNNVIQHQNVAIANYGAQLGITLGTTITAMLLLEKEYYIIHVGDSRAYEITQNNVACITHDQTVVMRDVQEGRITLEQAETDPRRSVLLQCVGASKIVEPAFYVGNTNANTVYMLCSDGFRHVITPQEIYQNLNPMAVQNQQVLHDNAQYLVNLNKQRLEEDNISVVLMHTF